MSDTNHGCQWVSTMLHDDETTFWVLDGYLHIEPYPGAKQIHLDRAAAISLLQLLVTHIDTLQEVKNV